MLRRFMAYTTILALLGTFTLAPATSAQAQGQQQATRAGALAVPVVGTINGQELQSGVFTIENFQVVDGQLQAVGTLVGNITNALGGLTTIVRQIAMAVDLASSQATCPILHLELGPLDLNLLGLVIHLDRIVLDIAAEPGPGNLLGNLLCAIAGLLDPLGPLGQLAALLNNLLRILG
jgi:hypothetical protein